MSGYTVKPRGIISQFKHGGFIVYEKDGHGLVAAIIDIGNMEWDAANSACDDLILNGYSDWHLPAKGELNTVYVNLVKFGFGGFNKNYYWSSTNYEVSDNRVWIQDFSNGEQRYYYKTSGYKCDIRAVRSF